MTARQKIEYNKIINDYFEDLIDKLIENQQDIEDKIFDKIEEYESYNDEYYEPHLVMLNASVEKIRDITENITAYISEMI